MRRTDIGPRSPSTGSLIVNAGGPGGYGTIQAAIDAAIAAPLSGGFGPAAVIEVAPGAYTGGVDVDLTSLGGNARFTIRCPERGLFNCYVAGASTFALGASDRLTFENVYFDSAITGTATGASSGLQLIHCAVDAAITVTGGNCEAHVDGGGSVVDSGGGYVSGISTTGKISVVGGAGVSGALTTAGVSFVELRDAILTGTFAITTAGTQVFVHDVVVSSGVPSFVFSGSAGLVRADEYSLHQLLAAGSAITNGVWGGRTILTKGGALTVAAGVVTATHSRHAITGEGGLADDLVTINGTVDGQTLVLSPSSDTVTITVKNGTGNIFLAGADLAMDNLKDRLLLISDGTNLYELGRGNNGA
jgi:hypothetical protein